MPGYCHRTIYVPAGLSCGRPTTLLEEMKAAADPDLIVRFGRQYIPLRGWVLTHAIIAERGSLEASGRTGTTRQENFVPVYQSQKEEERAILVAVFDFVDCDWRFGLR